MVVSGSVNEITLLQLQESKAQADLWIELSDRQKFDPSYTQSEEWQAQLRRIREPDCRLAVLGVGRIDLEHEGEFERQTPQSQRRDVVSSNLGSIAQDILHNIKDVTLAVFGGDTLYKLLSLADTRIRPCWEIEPGVVAAQLQMEGETRYLITKSGGFGSSDMIGKIQAAVNPCKEEF